MARKRPSLDASKCTVCGICVDKCVKAAISSNPRYGSKGGM